MNFGIVRSRLTILVLGAAALGTTGCELIPGLLNSSDTSDPAFTSAPLTVTIESLEGAVDGTTLDTTLVQASGLRNGLSLQFDVALPAQETSFTLSTPGADGSSENPYVGGAGDLGERFPIDAGSPGGGGFDPSFDPSRALVMACSPLAGCREAEDFGVEIAQDAQGRTVLLDGTWSGGDRVHIEMRYQEVR